MKNKRVWIAMAALLALIGLMAGLWLLTRQAPEAGLKAVTVTVVHKDTTQKEVSCRTEAENLGELLLEEGLAEGETGQYGLMINTVDGETADWNVDRSYWAIYIGEEYATTGADGILLTDGDQYSLVYTIG